MVECRVVMTPRACRDLAGVHEYIIEKFKEPDTAESLIRDLEKAVYGLSMMPERGALRKTGAFSNKNYRQIFVKNFTVVYRIDKSSRQVIVVTVRYTPSDF